jgi:cobalt-zinc-cadmium efflux system membrane fusion protein
MMFLPATPSPTSPAPRRAAFPLVALGLLATCLGLAACQDRAPEAAAPAIPVPIVQGNELRFAANDPQLAMIGLTAAAPGKTVSVELPARLVWDEDRTQRIYPAFAGRVSAIRADVGQAVRPGSVLAQLASPDFGQAQADTARAQAGEQLAQRALQRTRELFEAGIVARKDLEQAEADSASARAESQRAHARTRLYGGAATVDQQLALTAGVSGVVVERNLNPGQELRPDQSGPGVPPLFVISDPTSLWVQIDARENEADTLRPGSRFELAIPALPGQRFDGQVVSAADFIDPTTRTIKVRGRVANPDRRLKAEMLATVRVERTLGAGVVVPTSAVILRGTGHAVFVETKPGVFEPREVRLGYSGPREVLIANGLEVGDRVVSENALLIARMFRTAQDDVPAQAAATPASASK